MWEELINKTLKVMLRDLKCYQSLEYSVENDQICYIREDGFKFNQIYSYKTMFQYFF